MAVPHERAAPKSPHVSEPALAPFLQPQFDPADYLNAALPSLSLSSVSARPLKQGHSVSLAELSSHTQDLLSQLNAHTTRLSTILTQLTDDILRSGARLAYEVEVLRGETIGLTETLTEGLKGDVEKFLPGGITLEAKEAPDETPDAVNQHGEEQKPTTAKDAPDSTTPDYITQLHTLTLVRSRLETVIKVFGEAMHWTIPPSEISLTSSLISVSAPEPGTDASSREQKGKEFAASLRSEISDLITGDPESGAAAAGVRIQALRDLAQVWKGTAEEKARSKFIEGLARLAEEKQRDVEKEKERRQPRVGRSGSVPKPQPPPMQQQRSGGFLDNLQRIRGNF
ncbi:hypothetical protein BU26DRAFT_523239 [Trematosphaeria pertusa]|uniref:Uncharacterized protein n=1 Tax=Trematosphaeria pertusa TaxID=390896 RepID=A0A6A6HZZ7_9PLEO|nr:uncharacterized protein BU26DRAFT_523239 [Trematosphaeria pertusa]KAF2243651.1 hypothetical protein BU26DRAFT_523239 [Trematosphaeria pertusa]